MRQNFLVRTGVNYSEPIQNSSTVLTKKKHPSRYRKRNNSFKSNGRHIQDHRTSRDDLTYIPLVNRVQVADSPALNKQPNHASTILINITNGHSPNESIPVSASTNLIVVEQDQSKITKNGLFSVESPEPKDHITILLEEWRNRCLDFDSLRQALYLIMKSSDEREGQIIFTWLKAKIDKASNVIIDQARQLDKDDPDYEYNKKFTGAIMKIVSLYRNNSPLPNWRIILNEFFKVEIFDLRDMESMFSGVKSSQRSQMVYLRVLLDSLELDDACRESRWDTRNYLIKTSWLLAQLKEVTISFKFKYKTTFSNLSTLEKVVYLTDKIFYKCCWSSVRIESDSVYKSPSDLLINNHS